MVAFVSVLMVTSFALVTALTPPPIRINSKQYAWEIDEAATYKKSKESMSFPLGSSQLIKLSKIAIEKQFGLDDSSVLADDFIFQFPIVGPLTKFEFLDAVKGFSIKSAFPDQNSGIYDFRVDPLEPNRIWFTAVFQGTHSSDTPLFGKATKRVVVSPPQANSFIFNKDGKIMKYTGGYVMDKERGNTGGLGGFFGILYGVGRPFPFPEANPYQKSWQYSLFQKVAPLLQKLAPQPK